MAVLAKPMDLNNHTAKQENVTAVEATYAVWVYLGK
jgi:hypothetical protein